MVGTLDAAAAGSWLTLPPLAGGEEQEVVGGGGRIILVAEDGWIQRWRHVAARMGRKLSSISTSLPTFFLVLVGRNLGDDVH
ncbi:hypothetical protein E2562_001288 [Oryza meyeriana var. granulata]|uniref:Uncharacterized protein n=1 Tax=Oryza meyeriana var. granulata TaxID=110450 RepID=A0A6G1DC86_9ORYZ|nr:hypothetical protein E2562_001288 [Oryza meyeriana var. granulata]